MMEISYHPEIA